ncbi:PHD finger protein Alfin1-like [Rutidosis leptorrhynchoides]|uniref:PHD finger protein Alfin1-like n=1 Tax=Rutidosis leptorrhynchoides TaxID=125765 RepID=UPI003A991A32
MEGIRSPATNRTPEQVFTDFKGRRAGLIKALTTDVQKFYQMCDPEKDNLCLYGLPNEAWEVSLPVEEVPPELPEPTLGINFARNGMEQQAWLYLVAVHSDSWLLSVAFYFGARFGFNKNDRRMLFQMINDLPTVLETVAEYATNLNDQAEIRNRSSKSKSSGKNSRPSELPPKGMKMAAAAAPKVDEENIEEEGDEQGATCGACGDDNATDEFWICCDICEIWFHGKCVKITPAKAAFINQYKCPSCSTKKARLQD